MYPIFVLLLALCLPVLAWAQAQPVVAERLRPDERITLDGKLDHPAWLRAKPHTQFTEFGPKNGATPPQRTQVQVLFDEQALYIGVIAFDDAPQHIRAMPVRHDGVIRTQDFVVAYVDAIGHKRSAQFFRVGAWGSRGDGLHTASDDSEDFAPDFDWDAAVHRREDGWSAVMRLPFATLRYGQNPVPGQPWRFMLGRRLPREQFHLALSVPLKQGSPSFIDQLQPLLGVALPANPSFLTVRPSLTLRSSSGEAGAADNTRRTRAEASLDVKWRPLAPLVVDATVNPDFSQVALDLPQLAGNTRFALSLSEKRPFFYESADLWRIPMGSLYTRSLTQPRWGLRATWRSAQWAGTALAVQDKGGGLVLLPQLYGTDAATQPSSSVVAARVLRSADGVQLGAVLAARQYRGSPIEPAASAGANMVLGPDVNLSLGADWRAQAQWLLSDTNAWPGSDGALARTASKQGQSVLVNVVRQNEHAETRISLDQSGQNFRNDTGFVNQVGLQSLSLFQSRTWREGLFLVPSPFNEFALNAKLQLGRAVRPGAGLGSSYGELVYSDVRLGLYSNAPRNTEWWLELHPFARNRFSADSTLVKERFVASGLTTSPNRWWTLASTDLALGQLADASANRTRPGLRWGANSRLRPLLALEVEPSYSLSWLRPDEGAGFVYRESAAQVLAVWHLMPRHSLRAIVQQSSFDRAAPTGALGGPTGAAQRSRSANQSLTYAWQRSVGTALHIGATHVQPSSGSPRTEAFAKLQFDWGEVVR